MVIYKSLSKQLLASHTGFTAMYLKVIGVLHSKLNCCQNILSAYFIFFYVLFNHLSFLTYLILLFIPLINQPQNHYSRLINPRITDK